MSPFLIYISSKKFKKNRPALPTPALFPPISPIVPQLPPVIPNVPVGGGGVISPVPTAFPTFIS